MFYERTFEYDKQNQKLLCVEKIFYGDTNYIYVYNFDYKKFLFKFHETFGKH